MRHKLIILNILMLCGVALAPLHAQTTLSGRVLDASLNEPLPFATVALLSADSTVLTGTVADADGRFSFTAKEGRLLSFSCVGFNTEYRPYSAQTTTFEVSLVPSATTLNTVQVTAKAPVIEQQMDKLVMNVAQSAFAQGSNAEDLLRKAPGVSIDKDGNVKLNGQAVAVWIDGRPSQLDGKSLEALLRSTDGGSIDKIEVIANPSAKYDAEGQGGIINIRTKRNFKQGFNGSLSVNGGAMGFRREMELIDDCTDHFFDQDVNLNLNYRSAKTNTFLQLSESTSQMGVEVASHTDVQQAGYDFHQQSVSRYDVRFRNASLKLGNDWFIDSKNTLGVIFTLPYTRMFQWADTNHNRSYQMIGDVLTQQLMSYAKTDYRFTQYMGNLNYTHIFNEAKAAELTANLDYMHFTNSSSNPLNNYSLSLSNPLTWLADSIQQVQLTDLLADNMIDVYSAKVDWQSVVLGSFMMEAGGKWALSLTDNTLIRTDQTLGTDPVITPTFFDYTEHIGALYATLAGQLPHGITAKVGLRGEYTYAFNSTNTVNQDYFNLFPTLYAGYNTPDMMRRFSLTYTRRIQRPNYSQLNPFQNYIDAHTSNMGNPDLRPCFSNNVNLTAGFGQYVTLTGTYMHNLDVIGTTPKIDPATGDQCLYFDNVGDLYLAGGSLTLSDIPLGKKLTFMLSAQLYDFVSTAATTVSTLAGVADDATPYKVRSLYGSGYGCLTYTLPQQWKVQLDGYFSTPVTQGYMHIGWNYLANLAVKKSALDGRLLFSLSVNDLFRTQSNNFTVLSNGVEISAYDQAHLMQKVKVGLQWNFGTAQKPLRQRNVGNLDEASRTGNSTGIN